MPSRGTTQRGMMLVPATVTGLTVLMTWTYVAQAGLPDAAEAPGVAVPLAAAAAAALAVGAGAWGAQPTVTVSADAGAPAEAAGIDIDPRETVVWVRSTSMSAGAMGVLIGATMILAALAAALWFTGGPWVILAVLAALLALLVGAMTVFRVRITPQGLLVRSALGVPRFRIALADIARVESITVDAMAEFGGWGVRLGLDGRFGVVLRSGPALQVTRESGRVFVVTVGDADTAAAVLTALARRRPASRG